MEKAREHNTKLYLLFIDLRKAYDSIPRGALWQVLRKYGIPPTLVNEVAFEDHRHRASVCR